MADKETHMVENFINGVWTDALSGKTFKSLNPADTDDVVGIAPASAKADVDRAVEAAKRAFRTWRLVPAPKRGEILFRGPRS